MTRVKKVLRHLLPPLFIGVLAGCSASAKYDIDVKCEELHGGWVDEGKTWSVWCNSPDSFSIKCPENTHQTIESDEFCTTYDGKSVRIHLK